MAYGKKVKISTDLSDLIFGLVGESGCGKSTTLFHMAETLFGEDGYILLDMGSEYGSEYLEGVTAEPVETFKKFLDIVNDVIKNKDKEYPNLKLLIFDTLDALFEIGEPWLVKTYNSEHLGEKNFVPAKTINACEGGFMHGQDRLIDIIVEQIVKLKKAGVGVWYSGHVKRRSTDDIFTGETYDMLTTSMSQRYFEAIKNKTHALGVAYVDRSLTEQEIGKENPITHKKKKINKVTAEAVKVKFRDDSYTTASKSRLKYIIEEVNLNEQEIIEALKNAITEEKKNPYKVGEVLTPKKKTTKPKVEEKVEKPDELDEDLVETITDEPEEEIDDIFDTAEDVVEEEPVTKERLDIIRAKFKASDADIKDSVRAILKEHGGKLSESIPASEIAKIEKILGI